MTKRDRPASNRDGDAPEKSRKRLAQVTDLDSGEVRHRRPRKQRLEQGPQGPRKALAMFAQIKRGNIRLKDVDHQLSDAEKHGLRVGDVFLSEVDLTIDE
jgi:hypothetical protein